MNKTLKNPLKILYVSSTHWDREWYLTYQSFRFRLVGVMDRIIETLEQQPGFGCFMLDGQSIVLQDYLEIRPEMKPRIEALLEKERLKAGPWLTMPDERLVSGESLISNLLLGFELTRSLGGNPMKVGYVCDVFGHIAQLPQIFKGFGIDTAVLGRGTNDDTSAFFDWQSPDGSGCLTFKLPETGGYGSFYFDVVAPSVAKNGNQTDKQMMLELAIAYVNRELERSSLPYVLLMDGMDHQEIHGDAVWLMDALGKHYGCPVEITHPEQLLSQLRSHVETLESRCGELCQTARAMVEHNKLIPGVLSSRYDIKWWNDRCQTLMERTAWPLAALCHASNQKLPPRFFEIATRMLMENQAHDSICGCSIDAVCDDVIQRYKQAMNIMNEASEYAADMLADIQDGARHSPPVPSVTASLSIDCQSRMENAEHLRLTVFNMEPSPLDGVIQAELHFPMDYTARYGEYLTYEPQNMFEIYAADGQRVPYQLLSVENGVYISKPQAYYREQRDRYRVALPVSVAPMSYAELSVRPSAVPVRNTGTLRTGDLCAENEHIKVSIQPDGTLCMTEKASGRSYEKLLIFKDSGDCGDGWFYAPPINDKSVYGLDGGFSAEVWEDGSEQCTFAITRRLRVPARLEKAPPCARRSSEYSELEIQALVTLTRTARWLDVQVAIKNNVKNHKVSVCFDTGVQGDRYEADQAFALLQRVIDARPTHNWKELDRGLDSFSSLVMKRDLQDGHGFAFISFAGLHECKMKKDSKGTMEIALFRSFGNTFLTSGEPGGQLQGDLTFRFALLPLCGNESAGTILALRDRYISQPLSYSSIVASDYIPAEAPKGFSATTKNVLLSTVRPAQQGDSVCIRFVNYGPEEEMVELDCPMDIMQAFTATLSEERIEAVPFSGSRLRAKVGGYKILTLLLDFA